MATASLPFLKAVTKQQDKDEWIHDANTVCSANNWSKLKLCKF